ncbi:hypothetical protein CY34DRAFT_589230 [Suillus luteus UH-Slu-Lm8-n1]|uniref:Uncharacterized protein n=1 Tax=Suillus luteus UH-Slu-Lm8-n1 TaxID=930992 RepID=A0A0D0BNW3_9AGAM|nr:hypothetical protein CY34DRAFT_589230 [Suillus luteus UH-Slu-Lm8-n1]
MRILITVFMTHSPFTSAFARRRIISRIALCSCLFISFLLSSPSTEINKKTRLLVAFLLSLLTSPLFLNHNVLVKSQSSSRPHGQPRGRSIIMTDKSQELFSKNKGPIIVTWSDSRLLGSGVCFGKINRCLNSRSQDLSTLIHRVSRSTRCL